MGNREIVSFGAMAEEEQQAFADFLLKELCRHEDDCNEIRKDLAFIEKQYGIKPRPVYVGKWLDVK